MNNYFPQYTTDYISGVMSLRKPQLFAERSGRTDRQNYPDDDRL